MRNYTKRYSFMGYRTPNWFRRHLKYKFGKILSEKAPFYKREAKKNEKTS